MFKNLQIYRLTKKLAEVVELITKLEANAFVPCSASESLSQGWSAPREGGDLIHTVNQQALMCFTTEKKVLPSSAINAAVKAWALEIEEQQGFKPGRKLLKELKEQVTEEFMPRAFAARSNTFVWLDAVNGWLVIDSSSQSRADAVLKLLLKSVNDFPVEMFRVNILPLAAMTDWLAGDQAPDGFTIDQDAILRSKSESKATVKYTRHNLDPAEIQNHIASGKQCISLAMTFDDKISFVLTENLTVKRVKALDVLTEKANEYDGDERADGDFVLMAGEFNAMLKKLCSALGEEFQQQ